MTSDVDERAAVARRAAEAGGAVAAETFRTGLEVEVKSGKTDVVTSADRDAQARVVAVLDEAFPGEPVMGEEEGTASALPPTGPAWVVDPIDGSNNYVRGIPLWATSVAAVEDGETVAAATAVPPVGDTYAAGADGSTRNGCPISVSDVSDPERSTIVPTIWWPMNRRDEYAAAVSGIVQRFGDLRRLGSAQVALALVADGALEGVITNLVANPWDTLAGVHLVREAGGTVTDLEGGRWRHDSTGLVVSNGLVHDAVLETARAI
jgi:myo-inositol-1(or 4)-monophosphatase